MKILLCLLVLTVLTQTKYAPNLDLWIEGPYRINSCLEFNVYKNAERNIRVYATKLKEGPNCSRDKWIIQRTCEGEFEFYGYQEHLMEVGEYKPACINGKRYPNSCYLWHFARMDNWWRDPSFTCGVQSQIVVAHGGGGNIWSMVGSNFYYGKNGVESIFK